MISASEFYALQLDESKDVAGLVQLLVYIKYIYRGSVHKDILFCKPLPTRTTAQEIFGLIDSFIQSHGIIWTKCVGICTDGANAMRGRHSGVFKQWLPMPLGSTVAYTGKHPLPEGMSDSLAQVLDGTVTMVNFVK